MPNNIIPNNKYKFLLFKDDWLIVVTACCFFISFVLSTYNIISEGFFWKSSLIPILTSISIAIASLILGVKWFKKAFIVRETEKRINIYSEKNDRKSTENDDSEDEYRIQHLMFELFANVSLYLSLLSIFMPRIFMFSLQFVIPILWAVFYALVAGTYEDEEDIPKAGFWLSACIFIIVWTSGKQITFYNSFSFASLFFFAGCLSMAICISSEKHEWFPPVLRTILVITVLAIGVNNGINYSLASKTSIDATISDKYVLEDSDGDSYCFEITKPSEGIEHEQISVYDYIYEEFKVGDIYTVNMRKSIFNVSILEDSNINEAILINNMQGKKKILAISVALIVLLAFVIGTIFNLEILFIALGGAAICIYMTYRFIADGEGIGWIILSVALSLLMIIGFIWAIIDLILYGEIIEE